LTGNRINGMGIGLELDSSVNSIYLSFGMNNK
jgi:hypothetical protein